MVSTKTLSALLLIILGQTDGNEYNIIQRNVYWVSSSSAEGSADIGCALLCDKRYQCSAFAFDSTAKLCYFGPFQLRSEEFSDTGNGDIWENVEFASPFTNNGYYYKQFPAASHSAQRKICYDKHGYVAYLRSQEEVDYVH